MLLVYELYQLEQLVYALTGLCGNEHERRVGHEREIYLQLLAEVVHSAVGFVLDCVPLVYGDYARLALVVGVACDLAVLLGEAYRRVNDDNAHVGAVDCHEGAQNAEMLDVLDDLSLAAHSGGVDEDELILAALYLGVYRVAGGSGNVGDDGALLAGYLVDERGLSDVRLADDGYFDGVSVVFVRLLRREVLENGFQEVTGAVSVHGGNRYRVAETEVVELVYFRRRSADAVHLVYGEDYRLAALYQHGGYVAVVGGDSGGDIGDEYDCVGALHCEHCLLPHLREDDVVGLGLDTAGVDEHELLAEPLAAAVDTVAGNAGLVVHDGQALTHQLIEKCGLSHVRASYYCYYLHIISPVLSF